MEVGGYAIAKGMLCEIVDWNGAMWGVRYRYDPTGNYPIYSPYWSTVVQYLNTEDLTGIVQQI